MKVSATPIQARRAHGITFGCRATCLVELYRDTRAAKSISGQALATLFKEISGVAKIQSSPTNESRMGDSE
jgi:hypothetical protein